MFFFPLVIFGAQPNQVKTHIEFTGDPSVAVKSLSQCFHSLGYRFDVESLSVHNQTGEIGATAIGIRPFNPELFEESLKESGIQTGAMHLAKGVLDIRADMQKTVWNASLLGSDEGVELQKTNASQWFRVDEGQSIRIQPPYSGKWYPDITVLDGSMEVLYSRRSKKAEDEMEFELPPGARYLKVSNVNGMKVMQEGMWIESFSPGR